MRPTRMRSTKLGAVALAGLLSLTLAGCGDDEESPDPAETEAVVLAGPIELDDGITTSVNLDPGFVPALTELGVKVGVLSPTKLVNGTLVFTITGGEVTLYKKGTTGEQPFIRGVIKHDDNGIALTAAGKAVKFKNFDVNTGTSMLLTDVFVQGEPFAMDFPTFFLDGSTLNYPPTDVNGPNTATLAGTEVSLTPEAADALNMLFGLAGTDRAIPPFFPVGVATIVIGTG